MTTARAALSPLAARVLRALFELAQLDRPAHAGVLAAALGARSTDIAKTLVALDARGLVSADRARLTFVGLALATRLPALGLEPVASTRSRAAAPRALRGLAKARAERPVIAATWTPSGRLASH